MGGTPGAPPPPLDIARVTSSTYSKGGTKLLKGGTKLLKGGTKLLKGGTKLLKGGTKLLKGGTKLLKGGTKLLKGGTKLLKGGTKSLGWATGGGGGRTTPPTPPPPGYGPGFVREVDDYLPEKRYYHFKLLPHFEHSPPQSKNVITPTVITLTYHNRKMCLCND